MPGVEICDMLRESKMDSRKSVGENLCENNHQCIVQFLQESINSCKQLRIFARMDSQILAKFLALFARRDSQILAKFLTLHRLIECILSRSCNLLTPAVSGMSHSESKP